MHTGLMLSSVQMTLFATYGIQTSDDGYEYATGLNDNEGLHGLEEETEKMIAVTDEM